MVGSYKKPIKVILSILLILAEPSRDFRFYGCLYHL